METRKCLHCGDPFKGRIDKKFCDDQCRAQHNNRLNRDQSLDIRRINGILNKNRKILLELFSFKKIPKMKVNGGLLREKSFCFAFHTHSAKTRNGKQCYFIYDIGLIPLNEDHYLIFKKTYRT